MSDFARQHSVFAPPIGSINSMGWEAGSYAAPLAGGDPIGGGTNLGNGGAYFIPFVLNKLVTIYGLGWFVSTTSSGNVDCGIYDQYGAKIVSTGSTALGTISTVQTVSIAATVLRPGNYFLAAAQDNTSGILKGVSISLNILEMMGVKAIVAGGFPLPATATFARTTKNAYPFLAAFLNPTF